MRRLLGLPLRQRLFTALGALATLCIITGLTNLIEVNRLVVTLDTAAEQTVPVLRHSLEADMAHDFARAALYRAVLGFEHHRPEEVQAARQEFAEATRTLRSALDSISREHLAPAIQDALAQVPPEVDRYTAAGNTVLDQIDHPGAEQLAPSLDAFLKLFTQLAGRLDKFSDVVQSDVARVQQEAKSVSRRARVTIPVTAAAAVGFALLVAWLLDRQISKPLSLSTSCLQTAAQGVKSAFEQISQASQSLAEAASEQAASLEETSASLEEIAAMTRRNADHANNGKNLSQQARASATTGLERIAEMDRTLGVVKGAVSEMEAAVGEMQSSSQEIAKIIKTIDEIAFQTNLLALNAAVEAARAGEAGAGFAVVADEVRSLAQRSAQAAKDTSEKIEAAVKRSELGGIASKKVVQSLAEIETNARNIETVFNGIGNGIKSLDDLVVEISAASQEQSQGINEVNSAVVQMDKVTQSNAASAEENASAAEVLHSQVNSLERIVEELQTVVAGATQPNSAAPAAPNHSTRTERPKVAPRNWPNTKPAAVSGRSSDETIPFPEPAPKGAGSFKDF